MQNAELNDNDKMVVVVSISPQSLASIATRFSLNMNEGLLKITTFFKELGCSYVFNTTLARNFSLMEMQNEFIER